MTSSRQHPLPLIILGHLWAAPLTALGYLVAVLSGARWVGWGRLGSAVFASVGRGPAGLYFRLIPARAFTCGAVVVVLRPEISGNARTMGHEFQHVAQMLALGPLVPVAYAIASLVAVARGGNAYVDNWLERDARAAGEAAEADR